MNEVTNDLSNIEKPVNVGNPRLGWGSDVAAEMLRQSGIKYVSINPGASYRGFHDSIVNYLGNSDPKMLLCLHEDHAVHIAQGYAKATDEPMGCVLHSNVGLMHGLMATFNAWCYRAPIIMMGATGPVDSPLRRPWIDWIHTAKDQGALLRNYVKWDDEPRSAQALVETMLRANQIARSEPTGPVYVCLDAGLQESEIEEPLNIPDINRFLPSDPPRASEKAVAAAADLLLGAKNPIIFAGRGSRRMDAWNNRVKLAELLNAAVITDLHNASVFPTDHPLHCGRPTGRIVGAAAKAAEEADVVLSLNWLDLGGSLNLLNRDGKMNGTKVIGATLEQYLHNGWGMELFELPPCDVKADADPDAFVEQLLPVIEKKLKGKAKWDGKTRKSPEPKAVEPISKRDPEGLIQPADIVTALGEVRGDQQFTLNRVSSGGAGPVYHFRHPQDYLGHDGGGGLASGPGTSVGAALALKDSGRTTIAVLGDGDFMQGNTALWTAAHYRIPLLTIISNNRSNFNDEMHQETVAKDRDRPVENRWIGMRISEPDLDLVDLAKSLGVNGRGPVTKMGDLIPALEEGIRKVQAGEPWFINIHVDTGYAQPPLMRGGSSGS
ncbi:MAG: thiamine pyrophosphate-binding protein [Alphaproteobacteria bacterium]|nr:thiamine pyrophosphate-binding protein [Alphaproteobacteria bacterium]